MTARQRLAVVGIVVTGLFTTFWRLTTAQVLPDEIVYLRAGASLVGGGGDPNLEHPPLAKLLYGLGQQLTLDGVVGGRLVAAAASLAIGVLLFALVRRIAGLRAGLVAAALWAVLPHAGAAAGPLGQAGRLDRFAMLDPVATALMMGAVLAGWSWVQRPRWQAAVATGLLGGLAAGAKPTAVLALPAIVAVVLWVNRGDWRRRGAGVALAVLASIAGLALAYAPLGTEALDGLRYLVEMQSKHAADGHAVTVAGTTTEFPPWWSHVWFHFRDDGALLASVLLGAVVAAPLSARRRGATTQHGVALLVAVFATLFVALAASPVKLPFYRYVWWPVLVALVALVVEFWWPDCGLSWSAAWSCRAWSALVVLLGVLGLAHVWQVATISPSGYQLVVHELVDPSGFVRDGVEPMLLRGRPSVLAFYADPVAIELTSELDLASSVLLDPEITSRFPMPDVEAVLDDPAWACRPFASLTLCVRSP